MSDLPEPIHVCFVTGEYPPMRGGVGDYTARLAGALAQLGVRCSVVTSRAARAPARERAPLEPAVYPAIGRWSWDEWRPLVALIDDLRPDVVHLQYQTGAFGMHPAINLLPLRLRLKGRPPVALTYHDLKEPYLFPKAGPVRALANQVLHAAASAAIVTNQEDLVRVVRPGGPTGPPPWPDRSGRRKVDLIPIGSNIAPVALGEEERMAVRARLGLAAGEIAIGFFGFVDPWKGVDRLVDAFGELVRRGLPVRLVFVGGARGPGPGAGDGYERAIRERLTATGLVRRCVWTGFASPPETSAHLRALDCCALPFAAGACYRHGTLVAAIAHGLPIVTTRRSPGAAEVDVGLRGLTRREVGPPGLARREVGPPGLARREVGLPALVHGESALLVGTDDADELEQALALVAESAPLRARLRRGSGALAPLFEWDRIARMSLAVYERLTATAAPPALGASGSTRA